jgi:hypothetical protein
MDLNKEAARNMEKKVAPGNDVDEGDGRDMEEKEEHVVGNSTMQSMQPMNMDVVPVGDEGDEKEGVE